MSGSEGGGEKDNSGPGHERGDAGELGGTGRDWGGGAAGEGEERAEHRDKGTRVDAGKLGRDGSRDGGGGQGVIVVSTVHQVSWPLRCYN